MRVAYLVNRYPAPSHSFIRREIQAVEALGTKVFRFSIRNVELHDLPDVRDQKERDRTSALLGAGAARLIGAVLKVGLLRPKLAYRGFRAAFLGVSWRPMDLVKRTAYFAEAALLAQHVENAAIDHIHAHFGTNPTTVARIASKIAGVPYSFTVHGPDEFDAPIELDLRGKIADCAFCVAISSYGRSQLMRWSAYRDWPKIEIVRCGVEKSFLEDEGGSPEGGGPAFCTVARLSAQKGVPLLLAATARLANQGLAFKLSILGDGEMRAEVEAMIEQAGLQNHVTLVGWADTATVIDHLRGARAMVLPSFAEGLPVVIMEALSLQTPVITTAIAGIPELVDERCGWVVPAGSVEALSVAMAEALRAPAEQLSGMGQIGRERVAELHDASINGKKLNDLFIAVSKING